MADYIDKLRQAGKKATAGPWSFCEVPYYFQGSGPWRTTKAEDDFIALARNAWPALVEVVAAAEKVEAGSRGFSSGSPRLLCTSPDDCGCDWCGLEGALARLRASVGEGGQ